MTKTELINLLGKGVTSNELLPIVKKSVNVLKESTIGSVTIGEAQSKEILLNIYERRLKLSIKKGYKILGLEETLLSFRAVTGKLTGGYVKFSSRVLYFWFDETHTLSGIILSEEIEK